MSANEARIDYLSFSNGMSLTEKLVADGAPALPVGYTYRLHIKHSSLSYSIPPAQPVPPSVTARIGYLIGDEWAEVASFTEHTRSHMGGATVAACIHAYEGWEQ